MKDSEKTLAELFDFYAPEDKQDFFIAYLYLKHTDRFVNAVLRTLGMKTVPLASSPGYESVDELLEAYVKQIAIAAPSRDTNIYHGKVVRHEEARKLVTIDEPLRWRVPERVMPFAVARDVILEVPGAIALGRCPCRMNQPEPCLPPEEQETCLIMGDPFASFIAAHNPLFRLCARDEALAVLEKARGRHDVHTAYFKKEFGRRLMAICNCCSCCCMGMIMWNRLKGAVPFLAPSGYVSCVTEECTGCGACASSCPFHAITLDEDASRAKIDASICMGCGVCRDLCPCGGIELRRDPSRGEPLDIELHKILC